jgi:hypothetical protein
MYRRASQPSTPHHFTFSAGLPMLRRIILVALFSISTMTVIAQVQSPVLLPRDAETTGTVSLLPGVMPLPLPSVMPLVRPDAAAAPRLRKDARSIIASRDEEGLLFEGETVVLRIDPPAKVIERMGSAPQLYADAMQALDECPLWLRDGLLLKFRLLAERGLDDDFAILVTSTAENLKDEIAFTIANASMQTLTNARFAMFRETLVRNAEHIYKVADSLQYVRLVEHGSYAQRDYYTTTTYRIYDSAARDTIWSEIPREYYYWYIVHPKMDQEGVYVSDNSNDASGQRTYGYSWRDFIWSNPDPSHDYQPVNITTAKGTVGTIPRFGELMKQPMFLWDRKQQYLTFNRSFGPGQSALDMLGNWASRALPVDVQLPRAFQPNQILIKHNGMCNEDAFLVAAACRTALIPIVYLGCYAEDHVFGSVWDNGWQHFEFFRGGLAPSGNQYYGITNMLRRGSYGWKISMVEATRPDGYPFNLSANYADTCTVKLSVTDTLGNPIEGAMVQIYGPYGQGYTPCMHFFTNSSGVVEFGAGADKRYLVNLYHPRFGWSPQDSTRAYYLTSGNTVAGATYDVTVPYPHVRRANDAPGVQPPVTQGTHSILLTTDGHQVVSGVNTRDSQRSRFYRWESQGGGMLSAMLLDQENYSAFLQGDAYTCLSYTPSLQQGAWAVPVADDEQTFLVLRNRSAGNTLEQFRMRVELHDEIVNSIGDAAHEPGMQIDVHPHPVVSACVFRGAENADRIDIVDALGQKVETLHSPWQWNPSASLPAGMYFARIHAASGMQVKKVLLVR